MPIEQEQRDLPLAFTAIPASLALAGCGGDTSVGTTSTGAPVPAATASAPSISPAKASRFLAHATNGATRADIDHVATIGFDEWISRQFSTSRATTLFERMEAKGYQDPGQVSALGNWDNALWHWLLTGSDSLRQRVTLALLDIFTVGISTLYPRWRSFAMANFLDVLAANAFGNFRDLLEGVTYSTASGSFLTYLGSRKSNGGAIRPDENYAREIMQLFTIGLYQLDEDGVPQRDANGHGIATYSQNDVAELARVFTGLEFDGDHNDYTMHRRRLRMNAAYNDTGSASVLGQQITGGGTAAIGKALDILVAHPNTGPFISRRLIQSLVTSNPSRDYVRRVAQAFANNGRGERGDLKAVIRAVLLDQEARSGPITGSGRLRDPVQRFLNWAKAFGLRDQADVYRAPGLMVAAGKGPGWSPTVFNFHQPDFMPRLGGTVSGSMVAPEFQIVNEKTVLGYTNYMWRAVSGYFSGTGLVTDFGPYLPLAADPAKLVDELSIVLAAGQLSAETRTAIIDGCASITAVSDQGNTSRVRLATLMVLTSPDYLVLE